MARKVISANLAEHLRTVDPAREIDVVIELESPGAADAAGRLAAVSERQEDFTRRARPVEDLVRALGGHVLDRAWINDTLLVRVSARTVSRLNLDGIMCVDTPHEMLPEA